MKIPSAAGVACIPDVTVVIPISGFLLLLTSLLLLVTLVSPVFLAPPVVDGVPAFAIVPRLLVKFLLLPAYLLLEATLLASFCSCNRRLYSLLMLQSSLQVSFAGIPAVAGVSTKMESTLLLAFLLLLASLEWLMSPGVAAVADVCMWGRGLVGDVQKVSRWRRGGSFKYFLCSCL